MSDSTLIKLNLASNDEAYKGLTFFEAHSECSIGREDLQQIKNIFFVSSLKQTFVSDNEKQQFFKLWTEYYLNQNWPGKTTYIKNGPEVLGYVMWATNSNLAKNYYEQLLPSYTLFEDLFDEFPAHLHINLSPKARGQGVGSQLIEYVLTTYGTNGPFHIVTSEGARNQSFYLKNGFTFTVTKDFCGAALAFMGRP